MGNSRHLPRQTARRRSSQRTGAQARGREPGPAGQACEAAGSGLEGIDFGPLATLIGYRIRRAYGRVFQSFNDLFAPLNMAFGQYSVLMLIALNPGLSQMTLADVGRIDRSTIVPIIDRFVRMGWVRRTRLRQDRRRYSLRVTPTGQAVLDEARPLIATHEEQLVRSLSSAERVQLLELLAQVSDEQAPALRVHSESGESAVK